MEHFGAKFTGTKRAMGWHCKRQSVIYECHFMDFEDGSALARLAERIWEMEQCSSKISSVAGRGSLGAHFKRSGKASGFRVVDDWCVALQSSSACVGRDRWQRRYGPHKRGLNTKIHLAVDALGMPIRAIVTDGPRADCKEAIPLIQNLPCKVLLADRGYDSDEIVEHAKNSGIQPIIPPKKNRKIQRKYDKNLYKKRHLVENAFLRLKRSWRGIATRYVKRLSSFVAFVLLACAMDWLKFITLTRVDRL